MTREWRRQEKHGHAAPFSSPPSLPLVPFLLSFSFLLPAPCTPWHVEAVAHTLYLSRPRRPPLDGNCSRDRAFRTQSTTVKDSRLASARPVPQVDTTTSEPSFSTRDNDGDPRSKRIYLVFMPVISRTTTLMCLQFVRD